ncbi:hypothetical protein [Ruegeria faecimaris]|uniref:Uncharacterized protein n=1 Tax=Ruegeria faecimaris TaxID=686389 RepID=A0A521F226_9RHOB|nr:hypothetical protein [Ruegeria faecimaris]SMO89530.1 hypothetical protein SAMN06265380_11563 [Ruegeria faecimaris]
MPERRLVKERSRSSKARCGTAALAIFPVEGKSCCCQCGGSCVSEGVDAKVSFVRKSELQSLGLSVRIGLDLPNMQAAENGRIEPTLTDADRCPNDRNAQKADFAQYCVQVATEVYVLSILGLSFAGSEVEQGLRSKN